MKVKHRSKEYPNDRNKYPVKVDQVDLAEPVDMTQEAFKPENLVTSLPVPEVIIPPLTPLILEEGQPPAVVTIDQCDCDVMGRVNLGCPHHEQKIEEA